MLDGDQILRELTDSDPCVVRHSVGEAESTCVAGDICTLNGPSSTISHVPSVPVDHGAMKDDHAAPIAGGRDQLLFPR